MILNEGIMVRFGADMRDLQRGLSRGKVAVGAFSVAAVSALAAVTAQSVKMAAQLDRDLRLVATLGGEAAGNTEQLRKEVQALGVEFGKSFNQLARANYQAVSGGFKDIAQSMELTRAGTRLAVAGNADLVGSTEAVVKALNAFDLSAGESEKAAAQLWGITRDGIITVEQLGRFLADLPTAAAASGIEFEEMSAAISTLTAAGVPASTAMDQLRSAIIQLERRGITGTLVERMERFVGQGIGELTDQLGDQTAARGVLVLANNLDTFTGNVRAANDVTGDFETAVETMNTGPMAEWDQAQTGLNNLMTEFGNAILPTATKALERFNSVLSLVDGSELAKLLERLQMGTPFALYGALLDRRGGGFEPEPFGTQDQPFGPGGPPAGGGAFFPTPTGAPPAISADALGVGGGMGTRSTGSPLFDLLSDRTVIGQQSDEFTLRQQRQRSLDLSPAGGSVAGDLDFDFEGNAEEIQVAHDAMQDVASSSRVAAASAGILSGAIGGALTSAFVTAEGGAQRFVQGLLAQFAQLGIQSVIGGVFGLPGFATGGFTGSTGGIVHPNEFVMNAEATRSLGLGRLERMHQVAGAGSTSNNVNITVNAQSDTAQSIANVTADSVGRAMRDLTTQQRAAIHASSGAKYRG